MKTKIATTLLLALFACSAFSQSKDDVSVKHKTATWQHKIGLGSPVLPVLSGGGVNIDYEQRLNQKWSLEAGVFAIAESEYYQSQGLWAGVRRYIIQKPRFAMSLSGSYVALSEFYNSYSGSGSVGSQMGPAIGLNLDFYISERFGLSTTTALGIDNNFSTEFSHKALSIQANWRF